MQEKPLIVFVGAVFPSQYTLLCSHLRKTGMADAWFMTTPGHKARHDKEYDHLLSFQPDGKIVGPQSYYYTSKLERSARISRGLLQALLAFEKERGRRIDLIVAHSLWGAPNWLYDELDAAVVSYIEFPSFLSHGWDAAYPPDQSQRMSDRNREMLHYHQVLCSDLTIVPSAHARSLFPPLLQQNIEVQFEGFDIQPPLRSAQPPGQTGKDKPFTIAFSARDLSSAKGFETYMRLVDRLVREGDGKNARFIAIGDPKASSYGYEQQWVQRRYKAEDLSFKDHLLRIYPAAEVVEFPGRLPYAEFAQLLAEVDLFLYPLRHGVANWGLMEILARGGCVIGSNWGFVPELVQHDINGMLMPDNDDAWMDAILQLRNDPARRARYSQAALETGKRFHISNVAPRFMEMFRLAIVRKKVKALR
ncbi:glycosyltransferase [Comamonas sp. Y6]|uniref:Glycosyltransferase n=1 Tax=Comamonas resistens TaxID=3046670 RepID=A0ABY8STR1_9BURK|nr:glycosyltransferase [Comamonas resistens]MDL5035910.1 glycosyltransferase [Comamonas resistens]WHS65314.1 glycosyltransferase [Comamonas resistens]